MVEAPRHPRRALCLPCGHAPDRRLLREEEALRGGVHLAGRSSRGLRSRSPSARPGSRVAHPRAHRRGLRDRAARALGRHRVRLRDRRVVAVPGTEVSAPRPTATRCRSPTSNYFATSTRNVARSSVAFPRSRSSSSTSSTVYASSRAAAKVLNETFGVDPTVGIVVSGRDHGALLDRGRLHGGRVDRRCPGDPHDPDLHRDAGDCGRGRCRQRRFDPGRPGRRRPWHGVAHWRQGGGGSVPPRARRLLVVLRLPRRDSRSLATVGWRMRSDTTSGAGRTVAIVWTLLAYVGAIVIGLSALALYGKGAVLRPSSTSSPSCSSSPSRPGSRGLLLVVVRSRAIMSTASSLLLIVTSSVTEDIVHQDAKPERGRSSDLLSRA